MLEYIHSTSKTLKLISRKTLSRGFTLIELLVVIAIISLLSSIVLASLKTAKDKAAVAKGLQTMHNLELALNLYYSDHGDWPARSSDGRMVVTSDEQTGWLQLYNLLSPYIKATPDTTYSTYTVNNIEMISGGIFYMKGTEANPVQEAMYDSVTGNYLGCIRAYQAYYLSEVFLPQNKVTLGDRGFDPDAIDYHDGHIYLDPSIPADSCKQDAVF